MRGPQLHYYCSPSVFMSLIQNKELWLTSLTQSNDRAEGQWMADHWSRRLADASDHRELTQKGAVRATQEITRHCTALAVCFSEDPDLLSQWRGYAQDGTGFSVSFSRARLEELTQNNNDPRVDPYGELTRSLCQVHYGEQDTRPIAAIADELSGAFGDYIESFVNSDGRSPRLSFAEGRERARYNAARRLFTVKNGAFREEREWRMLMYFRTNNRFASDVSQIEFRESNGVLSPYRKLPFLAPAIEAVTMGPSCKTPRDIVEHALHLHEIDAEVRQSVATYQAR